MAVDTIPWAEKVPGIRQWCFWAQTQCKLKEIRDVMSLMKGQEAHGDLIQHCLGRENLTVKILYHFLQCFVLAPNPHLL